VSELDTLYGTLTSERGNSFWVERRKKADREDLRLNTEVVLAREARRLDLALRSVLECDGIVIEKVVRIGPDLSAHETRRIAALR